MIAQISQIGNPGTYGIYTVVANTPAPNMTWNLTLVAGTGTLTSNATYAFSFVSNGSTGATGATGATGLTGPTGVDGNDGSNSTRYTFNSNSSPTGPAPVVLDGSFLTRSLTASFATGSTAVFSFSQNDSNSVDQTSWWNALYTTPSAGATGGILQIKGLNPDTAFATYRITSWTGTSGTTGPGSPTGTVFTAECLAGSGSATSSDEFDPIVYYYTISWQAPGVQGSTGPTGPDGSGGGSTANNAAASLYFFYNY